MAKRGPRLGDPISTVQGGRVAVVVAIPLYQPHVPTYEVKGSDGRMRAVVWRDDGWLDTVVAVVVTSEEASKLEARHVRKRSSIDTLAGRTAPAICIPDAARGAFRGGKENRGEDLPCVAPSVDNARIGAAAVKGAVARAHARLDLARQRRGASDQAERDYLAAVEEVNRLDPGFYEGR